MTRREFIALLGGATAWPFVAHAQAPKLPTIGVLGTTTPSAWSLWLAGFAEELHKLGWVEGRTVAVEYRWAGGRSERFSEIAAEFVRLNADVIVTSGGGVLAAMQATSAIPIVFAVANNPVGTGMVASLARPGGNVTGLSLQMPDLAGKRLELLREIVPGFRRLGILGNIHDPASVLEMDEAAATARMLDLDVVRIALEQAEDLAPAIETHKSRVDALYICTDPLVSTNRLRIHALALAARLPSVSGVREYADAGGLISYGPSYVDLFRRAAHFVDKILKGAKPGDLPVEQPTTFELVINARTAKALGITPPASLLDRADEVIE